MIPKIIHYCWFGGNSKSKIIEKCIASWRKYCPDWKIIEWNESNYDVNKIEFMREAYAAKKWAFVSDVARLDILYEYGGVYLDTDVELFSSLEDWLQYDAVFAFETERCINTGLGFASLKGNAAVLEMIKHYEGRHFIVDGKMQLFPCPEGNTRALCAFSNCFQRNGTTQLFNNVKVLSIPEYRLVAKHHYEGAWVDGKQLENGVHPYRDTKWKRFIRQPRFFTFIEKHFSEKVLNLYTFYCYDLQEFGVLYFLRRKFRKWVER